MLEPELGKLELDVVTCHHGDYYGGILDVAKDTEDPVPVVFPAGTGTAGKHSDVAQGLANSIRQVRPRNFRLVPSAFEKSIPVADLIRETVADPKSFAPWTTTRRPHSLTES